MDVRYLMLALTGFIEYNENIFNCSHKILHESL